MKIEKEIPKPPKPPLGRIINQGTGYWCNNCNSTCSKKGFLGIFGQRLCDNEDCPNSKTIYSKHL